MLIHPHQQKTEEVILENRNFSLIFIYTFDKLEIWNSFEKKSFRKFWKLNVQSFSSQSFPFNKFVARCNLWQLRPLWRTIIDLFVLYLIPVCLSGYLYFKIIQTLRTQEKHAERNRNLSICFFASWCSWAICWAPKFIINFMQLPSQPLSRNLGKGGNTFLVYLFISLPSIQVLYSQLNPFLYLILFKSFQQRVLTLLKLVLCIKVPRISQNTRHMGKTEASPNKKSARLVSCSVIKSTLWLLSLTLASGVLVSIQDGGVAVGFSQVGDSRKINNGIT